MNLEDARLYRAMRPKSSKGEASEGELGSPELMVVGKVLEKFIGELEKKDRISQEKADWALLGFV